MKKTPSRRTCDIVMKGGITSGVVYPQALTRLADRFDFRNIGGTSAGAIAAALTAAAQHRRNTEGSERGFEELEQLPDFLSSKDDGRKETNLFHLFQPSKATASTYGLFSLFLGGDKKKILSVLRRNLLAILFGAIPGFMLAGLRLLQMDGHVLLDLWFWLSLLIMCAGIVIGLFIAVGIDAAREISGNHFGLCSGMPGETGNACNPPALTSWLHRRLNEMAGLTDQERPLTFGDLWGTDESDPELADRLVNLEMMTTNLTHGRPYRLPFRESDGVKENRFYFRPDEFRKLFPAAVVDWMIEHPRQGKDTDKDRKRRARRHEMGYHPLPDPADLPVVVATRMSLSFPILLSAIPLHAVDFSEGYNETLERIWFSDGGISSNFPLHFFDSALPRRPTFSIDLTQKPAGTPKDELIPYMEPDNGYDPVYAWNRFDQTPTGADKNPLSKVLGFIWTIISTMQNWTDTTQSKLPGFRDRIVSVPLTPDEGGLNLNMPPDRIMDLTQRGKEAAEELLRRFDVPAKEGKMNWDNHRWVRLRSSLSSLDTTIRQLEKACTRPENGDIPYDAWMEQFAKRGVSTNEQPSYEMTKSQLKAAIETLKDLRDTLDHWPDENDASDDAPRPRPVLCPRPQI